MSEYDEFIRTLYRQNEFAIKLGLDAVKHALGHFNVTRVAPLSVLVAGTNGKGTVSVALNALCTSAGLKCGLFTSPHLVDFRERIRIDGAPISEDALLRVGAEVVDLFGGARAEAPALRPLTFFELSTVIAGRAFASANLDVAIIEVGMGGRLDATNAFDVDLACVTSISLDHQQWLGESVVEIAREKLGIARPGVPVIAHRHSSGAHAVEVAATDLGVEESLAWIEGGAQPRQHSWALARELFDQICMRLALPPGVARDAALSAPSRMRWAGRQQMLEHEGRTFFVDGAHNEDAVRLTADWLELSLRGLARERLPAIMACSPGRQPGIVFERLIPHLGHVICVPASEERTLDPGELARALRAAGAEQVEWTSSIDEALEAFVDEDELAILGSLYLVGGFLDRLGFTAESLPVYE